MQLLTAVEALAKLRTTHALHAYDALAYDNVSVRAARGGLLEKLPHEVVPAVPIVEVRERYSAERIKQMLVDGDPLPGTPAHYRARCINNVLLPTGANALCPRCGMTRSCRCEEFTRKGRRIEK